MKTRQAALVGADAVIVAVILALVAISLTPTYEPQVSTSSATSTTTSYTQVSTSSATSTAPLVFASAVAANGLQVKLYLNSTSMRSDGAITGFVTVANTLDQNVTVTPLPQDLNSTMPASWISAIDPCGSIAFPGGYAVFQGHFTTENISLAAHNPLVLTPGPGGSCTVVTHLDALTFLPGGGQAVGRIIDVANPNPEIFLPDQLNVTSYVCTGEPGSANVCSVDPEFPGLVGYWYKTSVCNGNPVCTFLPFAPFSPGQYTIVAWDDWNQYVYVTFVVQPAASSP